MKTSETVKEIFGALAKAQSIMAGARKDATNPHFKSKYADLASVWDACREALTANGIAVIQMTEPSDKDEIIVDTRLAHSSGEWIEGRLVLPVSKADAQGYGSALTYARRYGLSAAVGVAPEDDDGNLASAAKPGAVARSASIDPKAEADLLASLDEATDTDDLRERTRRALAVAHEGGDVEAFKRIKAASVMKAERFKSATVQ